MIDHMHPTTTTAQDLITSPEAAAILGCSSRTVHRHVTDGELHPVRRLSAGPNGAFLFDVAEVEALARLRNTRRTRKRATA